MLFKNVGRRRRCQPRAHAQPVDRHADRAHLGLGGDDRLARILQLSRALHLLRHGPARAARREADRLRLDPTSPRSARSPAAFRSKPGSCPSTHSSHFENIPKPGVDDLGRCFTKSLNKLEIALDSPAYNYIIHTAPFDHGELPHYHWHIEVIPRLTKVAGFEWGSGFYINPVPPESAARFLREVDVASSDGRSGRIERSAAELCWAAGVMIPAECLTENTTMSQVRLILALHNHQPVGNFDGVFEEAYRTSYLPFLDVLENYPEIPFALHTSGPAPRMAGRQASRIHRPAPRAGRVGPGRDPGRRVLRADPDHDPRPGPGRSDPGVLGLLQELFGAQVRGMWVAERVWEQHLVSAIVEAGIEYTVLDDFHFERAGCSEDDAFGYYLTEDDGRLLKVFPAAEKLRYSIPFQEPHETYEFLKRAGRDAAPARPSSSPTTARSSEAGQRHSIMFIHTDG